MNLPPLTEDEAMREVAWIARRARELSSHSYSAAPAGEYREFFARKIRLLKHIGTPESLALVPANVSLMESFEGQQ